MGAPLTNLKEMNNYLNDEKFNKYFFYYLSLLFFFSVVYLIQKHDVGNDSTISEWLINYEGGFTKRGLIGQINIFISNFFKIELRESILLFQVILVGFYFYLIFNFFKKLEINKIILLAIFTPVFILFPVAEVEVLARKEVFIFCMFIMYISLKSLFAQNLFKLVFLTCAVLIWEPVIFYFLFFISVDIIKNKFKKIDQKFILNLIYYLPAVLLAIYIAFNPMTSQEHDLMSNYLKNNFGEECYMSCGYLKTKSSIYSQFQGNFNSYSYEVFIRYFLIITIGFLPLIILLKNSYFIDGELFYFKNFKNLLIPISLLYLPVVFLFAMGYDWGRWVNISYVFGIITYIYLLKHKIIVLDKSLYTSKIYLLLGRKKIFIFIFIIFCFGWNPKTVISGDVATNPLWKVPYNASKFIFGFNNFRILQDSPLSIWHKKYIE